MDDACIFLSCWFFWGVGAVDLGFCSYQLEVLEKAKQENTIVYLETGTGKTLIAAMLLQSIAHRIRKPSRNIVVFLGPTVCLIQQVTYIPPKSNAPPPSTPSFCLSFFLSSL
jgi:ERCC4-related helicase